MFAQLAAVTKVGIYDEVLYLVNSTNFGLTSGNVTKGLARATYFRQHMKAGCVMISSLTAGTDYRVPFGGRGNSSCGPHEQASYAATFYISVKTSYIFWGQP